PLATHDPGYLPAHEVRPRESSGERRRFSRRAARRQATGRAAYGLATAGTYADRARGHFGLLPKPHVPGEEIPRRLLAGLRSPAERSGLGEKYPAVSEGPERDAGTHCRHQARPAGADTARHGTDFAARSLAG